MRFNIAESSIFMKQRIVILLTALIGAALIVPAYSNTQPTALLLQQTPANGGTVTPATGVHKFETDSMVTLTAIPNPGYQFVYWLGDVSDPTSTSTVAYLDSPKIIIAVFERSEHQFAEMQEMITASAGFGGRRRSAGDYSRSGGGGGIGPKPRKWQWPSRPEPPEEPEDDLPVPEESNETDLPVPENEPVPEPATALLLVMGSLLTIRKRRKRI